MNGPTPGASTAGWEYSISRFGKAVSLPPEAKIASIQLAADVLVLLQ